MAPIIDFEGHNREFQPRLKWLVAFMVAGFVVIACRFSYLQLVRGDYYVRYAARNSFKAREIAAPRGIIFDRHGNRIADVRPSFDVVIRPNLIRRHAPAVAGPSPGLDGAALDIGAIAKALSRLLHIPAQSVVERFKSATGRARYKPVVIKPDVSRDEMAAIEAHRIELPGVAIQVGQKRTYTHGDLFSHLVGYLGEVNSSELEHLRELYGATKGEDYYEIGDFVGKYGIEKQYEPYLKGEDGVYYVLEDATGRMVTPAEGEDGEAYARSMLAHLTRRGRPASPGNDLVLTIDLELQRRVRELMEGHVGSVVAMEPGTGRILAMFNNPTFDPEIFARGISREAWETLRTNPEHPLEDKALRGQYPPGSTFKMIPALAALAEGVVTTATTVYCPGYIKIGGRKFRCHKRGGHGYVDIRRALVESCDVYFYAIGAKLGVARIAKYARAFGLGAPTGLGLNEEKPGLVPSEVWKLRVVRQPWVIGDTVSATIGQGYNLVTPLQLARYTSALANGGRLMRPYVVERIQTVDGRVIKQSQPEEVGRIPVDPATLGVIQSAMLGVLEDPSGTARRSKLKGIRVAGKTGTAQVVRKDHADQGKKPKRAFRDHALFTAYAPAENPEIVVSVIVEHGGHGGAVAAPIAREVMRTFFDRGELPVPGDRQARAVQPARPGAESVVAVADASPPQD